MSKFCASLRLAAPEPSTVGGLHRIPSRPGRLAAPHTHDRRLRAVPSQAAHRRCCPRCPARPATERRAFTGRSPAMRPTLFPPCPPARNRSPLPAEPVNSPLDDPGTALAPRPGMACPLRLRHPLYLFGLTERSLPACGMKTLPYWLRFGDYFLAGPNPRDTASTTTKTPRVQRAQPLRSGRTRRVKPVHPSGIHVHRPKCTPAWNCS